MHDDADTDAEEAVDLAHPFAVALRQVIVDGDDVDALPRQRVQIDRQRRHQRLAFTGLHLGDHAAMQHHAAHQLHVEMALPQGAFGRLAHRREGLDQDVVELLARDDALLEGFGAAPELGIRQRGHLGLKRVDLGDAGLEAFNVAIVCRTKQSPGKGADHQDLGRGNAMRGAVYRARRRQRDRIIYRKCQFGLVYKNALVGVDSMRN